MNRIDELRAALTEVSCLLQGHNVKGLDGQTVSFIRRKIDRALALDDLRGDSETWTVEQILEREG